MTSFVSPCRQFSIYYRDVSVVNVGSTSSVYDLYISVFIYFCIQVYYFHSRSFFDLLHDTTSCHILRLDVLQKSLSERFLHDENTIRRSYVIYDLSSLVTTVVIFIQEPMNKYTIKFQVIRKSTITFSYIIPTREKYMCIFYYTF